MKVKRKRRMSRRRRERTYIAVMVLLAIAVSIGLTRSVMRDDKRFRAIPEITHRKYKERGLIAPMKPEETPDYSFRDLQLCIYHTITI